MTTQGSISHFRIRPLLRDDLTKVKAFTDREIGEGYFKSEELEKLYDQTLITLEDGGALHEAESTCSFVLVDAADEIVGLRLAFAPGRWSKGKGRGLRPDLWNVDPKKAGYFQSLFLADRARGSGLGPELSKRSKEIMIMAGAKAIVTHAWKESPDNSSIKYLSKAGFQTVCEHKNYWSDVDYVCTRDGKPCRCTAVEMIQYLTSV